MAGGGGKKGKKKEGGKEGERRDGRKGEEHCHSRALFTGERILSAA